MGQPRRLLCAVFVRATRDFERGGDVGQDAPEFLTSGNAGEWPDLLDLPGAGELIAQLELGVDVSRYRAPKGSERRLARLLGGQRRGPHGGEDVDAGMIAAESMHRKRVPQWLKDAVAQARRNAGSDRLGVVVLHEHGKHAVSDLVVWSLADWLDWFGTLTTE